MLRETSLSSTNFGVPMNKRQSIRWIVLVAPFTAALPFALGGCSGSDNNNPSDASTHDGTGGSSGSGSGSSSSGGSSGSSSGAGSSSGSSSGTGSSSGSSSSGSGGSSSGSSSGGTGDAGPEAGQDAGTLCTPPGVPGNPPGCVPCFNDTNCPTTAPHCLNSACVTCRTSNDCGSGTTPVCYPNNHTCRASCAVDGGVQCIMGSATSHCDLNSGACVGCRVGGSDCMVGMAVCDPTTQQCVQCLKNSDCMGTVTPLCDTANNTCVGCLSNSDCTTPAAPVCRLVGGIGVMPNTCVPGCVNDTQCSADAGTPRCDTAANVNACVQCLANGDCSGTAATPFCDTAAAPAARAHHCEECLPAAGDAGIQGCDGGAGSMRCAGMGIGGGIGPLVCQ
jgi:hypothetical protein